MNESFTSGAFILNRTIFEEPVFSNPNLLKAWIYCLGKANFKDKWVSFKIGKGLTEIHVKRGQFIYGRNKVAEALNIKPTLTRTLFEKLVKFEYIKIEATNQYSIVTILKYNELQDLSMYKMTTNNQPKANQRTTKEQPITNQKPTKDTTNNVINNKNDKNEKDNEKKENDLSLSDLQKHIEKPTELKPVIKKIEAMLCEKQELTENSIHDVARLKVNRFVRWLQNSFTEKEYNQIGKAN
jgi:hypothetical protein